MTDVKEKTIAKAVTPVLCEYCGKIRNYQFGDMIFERYISGKMRKFCSHDCRAKFTREGTLQKNIKQHKELKNFSPLMKHFVSSKTILDDTYDRAKAIHNLILVDPEHSLQGRVDLLICDIMKNISQLQTKNQKAIDIARKDE